MDSYNIYYGMNSGYDGAAMYVASSGGGLLHASINRTEFVGNGTSAALSIVPGEQSQIVVTNSLFESNLGSAISFFSGPVASSLTVSASRFIDNGSDSVGGGILTVTTDPSILPTSFRRVRIVLRGIELVEERFWFLASTSDD
ncbi:MAG: hypothetical protein IPM16_20705 [Chloroflexi bacterium]|nr:hypothetical protein [Chloroflexota bacterium]